MRTELLKFPYEAFKKLGLHLKAKTVQASLFLHKFRLEVCFAIWSVRRI